jgi:hypothetical protein
MNMNNYFKTKQNKTKGNILPLLLIVFVLLGALVAWMSNSKAPTSGNQSAAAYAGQIVEQSNLYRTAFETLVSGANGSVVDLGTLTFDAGATGFFNPSIGGAKRALPPIAAYVLTGAPASSGITGWTAFDNAKPMGQWAFFAKPLGAGLGIDGYNVAGAGSASGDVVVATGPLSASVCTEINKKVNSYNGPAPVLSSDVFNFGSITANTGANLNTGYFTVAATSSTALTSTLTAQPSNWTSGCVSSAATNGQYYFYNTIYTQ